MIEQNLFDDMNTTAHNLAQIMYLKGDINYTEFHLIGGQKEVSSKTLLRYQEVYLQFIRISRRYLINPEHISGIEHEYGDHEIVMSNGIRIKIPRRKLALLGHIKKG